MSTQAIGKKTITCVLCGGVHIYPGPRFGNHLLHEHGIVFNQEYIIQVSLYKGIHSSLPVIRTSNPKTDLNQSSQTDLTSQTTCSWCARPVDEFLTSTPIRKSVFHNPKSSSQPINTPSPSSYFSTPNNKFLTSLHCKNSKQDKFIQGAPTVGLAPDLPARSGFLCKCALCHYVTNDDTTFWGHITKKHGLNFKKYKDEHGTCQTAIGSGKFECLICRVSMKHMPCGVDKHLKNKHGMSWLQYLAKFKELRRNQPDDSVGTGEVTEASSDLTMEESHDYLQPPDQTIKKSRPHNIKDKTNTYCSYCEVTFNTRMTFLKHCRDVHNLKFKTRSGAPVELDKTSSCVEDVNVRQLMLNPSRKTSPSMNSTSSSTHLSHSSAQDMVVSSSRQRPGEGAFPCEHCKKMFSSYSNMERHARLSCSMRGGSGQQVIPVHVKPDARVGDGAGFKCRKCARVFTKLGNLNRHYISTCFSPANQ